MNPRIKNFLLCLTGASLIFQFSCKDPSEAGLDVLPSTDLPNVYYTDTSTLVSYTVLEDSILTSNLSTNMVGSYFDPVFGLSKCGFYAQLAPLKNAPDFGLTPQADSVILSLAYAGSYGDTNLTAVEQTFNVYRISQDIYKDSFYYSNRVISYDTIIGSGKFTYSKTDTILNLKLDTAFFRKFILSQSGQPTLASVTAFQTYFKGIYVTPAQSSGKPGNRIFYFNLSSIYSRLRIYYQEKITSVQRDTSLIYEMQVNSSCATANHFYHNYVSTPVATQLFDSSLGATQVYLQSMAGVKAKIRMPFLKNFKSIGNIAINNAELIVTAEPNSLSGYAPAARIKIQKIDSLGKGYDIPGYFADYNATQSEYLINVNSYIQQVLTGETTDYGLFLAVWASPVFANRNVLQGAGPMNAKKIRLKITYSYLN